MPSTVLVVNPRSAGGKTERRWPQLRQVILEAYGPFEERFTKAPGDGTELARQALRDGALAVVALGGDGTINEVVNGFFDGDKPINPTATFGVLPSGSGGDFVKTLGTPKDLRAAATLLKSEPKPIDVGRLSFIASDGSRASRHFINISSFGMSGLVDRYVNRSSKPLGGTMTFVLATLRAGTHYKNANVRLTLDGRPPKEGKIYTVAVANGRYFGGGMKVAPEARLDDGLFDVVTLGDYGFSDLLLRGLDVYSGKHIHGPKVTVHRARRVEAEPLDGDGSAEVLIDVDGEQPGRLPATFELLPGALRVRGAA
jgi:YegS/Rv2252/BmrU family lipid kinase